jgi:hypothetical protein
MDVEGGPKRPAPRINERDRVALMFAAQQRLALAGQIGALLGVDTASARKRLHRLAEGGYVRFARELSGPGCYLIERRGLAAIGSRLPPARAVNRSEYEHDVGLGWLWLAARRGVFGKLDALVSERQMRSHDRHADRDGDPLGVRLPGIGPRGGERLHYPDLLLECRTGHRVAVELELTPKSRVRREAILGGYAVDARVDVVLYLVADRALGEAIARSAAKTGVSSLVRVQMVSRDPPGKRGSGRATARGRARDREAGAAL